MALAKDCISLLPTFSHILVATHFASEKARYGKSRRLGELSLKIYFGCPRPDALLTLILSFSCHYWVTPTEINVSMCLVVFIFAPFKLIQKLLNFFFDSMRCSTCLDAHKPSSQSAPIDGLLITMHLWPALRESPIDTLRFVSHMPIPMLISRTASRSAYGSHKRDGKFATKSLFLKTKESSFRF